MGVHINLNGVKKINDIFTNVNGEKKNVVSVWVNKDGVATKIYTKDSLQRYILATSKGIFWSEDKINWNKSDCSASIKDVMFNNNVFVAVSYTKIYYSTNGKNWLESSLPDSNANGLFQLAFGKNVYVVISSNNKYHYISRDFGVTWESISSVAAYSNMKGVYFVNDKFYLFSISMNSITAFTSSDGINWTKNPSDSGPNNPSFVSLLNNSANGTFFACVETGTTGKATIYYSYDGINWSNKNLTTVYESGIKVIVFKDVIYYIASKYVFYSTDLESENWDYVSNLSFDGVNYRPSQMFNDAYNVPELDGNLIVMFSEENYESQDMFNWTKHEIFDYETYGRINNVTSKGGET